MKPVLTLFFFLVGALARADDPAGLEARLVALGEKAKALEYAIIQFNLGIGPDKRIMESSLPAPAGESETLARLHSEALQELARLAARHEELRAGRRVADAHSPSHANVPRPAGPARRPMEPRRTDRPRPAEESARSLLLGPDFVRPTVDLTLLADELFAAGRYEEALEIYSRMVASGEARPSLLHREALCIERIGWRLREAGDAAGGLERIQSALGKLAALEERVPGTVWSDAALFGIADIEWRLAFESKSATARVLAEPTP